MKQLSSSKTILFKLVAYMLIGLLLLGTTANAFAAEDDFTTLILETLTDDLNAITADPLKERVFVSDATNKQILVVDSAMNVTKIALPGVPHWLATTKDGSKLGVAIDEDGLVLIDLNTLAVQSQVAFNRSIVTFDFDSRNQIYFSTKETFGPIYKGNPVTGDSQKGFDAVVNNFFSEGLVRSDSTGGFVFVQDGPGGITMADVRGGQVNSVKEGSSGVGIDDFCISPDASIVYLVSVIPSGIIVVPTSNLDNETLVLSPAGSRIVGVAMNSSGTDLYAVGSSGSSSSQPLHRYNADTKSLIKSYGIAHPVGESVSVPYAGLAVTPSGNLRFMIETVKRYASDSGRVVGVVGAINDEGTPSDDPPSFTSPTVSKRKLSNKGGTVDIGVTVTNPAALSSVEATATYRKKTIRATLQASSASTSDSAVFIGTLKFPKNRKKKTVKYLVTIIGTVDAGDSITLTTGKVTVKKKRKKKKKK